MQTALVVPAMCSLFMLCGAVVQVFSRVVSHGLEGRKLRATYKEADQLDYQDSLGQLVLSVAATVPDGMLLFLPSYALMDKLSKRWQVCVTAFSCNLPQQHGNSGGCT